MNHIGLNRIVTRTAKSLATAGVAAASLLAAMPVAGAAPATKGDTPGTPRTSSLTRPRCDEGHWPAPVQGQPVSFSSGARAGYYIWHDASGWHLRTTTPSAEGHSFTGKITASDNIKVIRTPKNEPADSVRVSGKTMVFRFDTHGHVDGIDFKVGCTESVKFTLTAEGRRWNPDRIRLGATGTARTNPFTVARVA